ncbi:MAG: FtsW/RodA/SpoVE family cell cycle protein [Clostridiales bacterium]|nr:FtsW/RodA/SpoVE family cell cycle protein [Clostridiales bacterium]
MEFLITNISKYIMVILIIAYTYHGFRSFNIKEDDKKRKLINKMRRLIFYIHFIAYLVLFINIKNEKILIFYISQVVVLALFFALYQWVYPNLSRLLLNNVMFFVVTGLIILTRVSFDKAIKQFVVISISFFISLFIPLFVAKLKVITKFGWAYGFLGIVALLSVFVIGSEYRGATNWILIGGFSVQPSEFVKILFIFAIAGLLSQSTEFKHLVKVTILAACHVLILVFQRDLGGALIFYVAYLIMLYVATKKPLYFFAGLGAGIVASYLAYNLFSHVRVRVIAWQDPFSVIDNEGYQVSQSLFAISTGGWYGMGLTKGLPESIPIVDSDFIFSAISEEMGGIYAICLILINITTLIMAYNISAKIQGKFYKLVALGLTSMIGFQGFLSIGGVTKFIPSTGVTLPFISYGGSSILSSAIMFAIIEGIFILNQDMTKEYREEEGTPSRD